MSLRHLRTSSDVDFLIERLVDPIRTKPVVVISTIENPTDPVDVAELDRQVGELAELYLVPTGPLTYQFRDSLPDGLEVYGGAVRTFPVGTEWRTDSSIARRRFPYGNVGFSQLERVVDDVFAMANAGGELHVPEGIRQLSTTAVVKSLLADGARAMVQLPSGDVATVAQESTVEEVPLDAFLQVGDVLHGTHLPNLSRFVLQLPSYTEAEFFSMIPQESVTLGLVRSVDRKEATVTLFPGLDVKLTKPNVTTNKLDTVDDFYSVGDVIRVRVCKDAHNRLAVRTLDIDDDEESLPQLPIVVGGLPWLPAESTAFAATEILEVEPVESFLAKFELEHGRSPVDDQHADEAKPYGTEQSEAASADPVVPTPRPGLKHVNTGPVVLPRQANKVTQDMALTIQQRNAKIAELETQIRTMESRLSDNQRAQLVELVDERNRLRDEMLKHKKVAQDLRKRLNSAEAKHVVGLDYKENRERFLPTHEGGEQWVRFEIELAWVQNTPPTERAMKPLPAFEVGEHFAESLLALANGQIAKSLRAVVDLVSGNSVALRAREPHPLRTGNGPAAPQRSRGDGATCWRLYVETNTPQARRLHYWKTVDQGLELSRIVLHDDFEP